MVGNTAFHSNLTYTSTFVHNYLALFHTMHGRIQFKTKSRSEVSVRVGIHHSHSNGLTFIPSFTTHFFEKSSMIVRYHLVIFYVKAIAASILSRAFAWV
jgi:hypothetical protein